LFAVNFLTCITYLFHLISFVYAHSFDPKAQSRRSESQWRKVYSIGAFAHCSFILLTLLDLILGSLLGGNLSEMPLTASERFMQFNNNPLLGLYNL
jgi:hypothetical protein